MPRSASGQKRLRAEKAAIIKAAKDKPCADCGRRFPIVAMDLDHIRGRKKYDISKMRMNSASVALLRKELAKCELVCACCHRVRTLRRRKRGRG